MRGRLAASGWAVSLGFPGSILDPLAAPIKVYLFESVELPYHWARLDEFEGAGYRRVVTQVRTAKADVNAWIYVIAGEDVSRTELA